MSKWITYLILFLSLSGLLFANEQKIASLPLSPSKGVITAVSNQKNIPPSADDIISIDFCTNYYFVRYLNNEQDDFNHVTTAPQFLLERNEISKLFVQKTLNFFKSQSIHLLNCIWLI